LLLLLDGCTATALAVSHAATNSNMNDALVVLPVATSLSLLSLSCYTGVISIDTAPQQTGINNRCFLNVFLPFVATFVANVQQLYLQRCAPACAVVPLPADISYIVSSEVDCYFVKFAPTHSTHHGWDPCTLPIRASFH